MNRGTRRMWSRRVLRAGWVLAPVLQFPAKAWKFFFETKESTLTTLVIVAMLTGVTQCSMREHYLDRVATGAEIEAAVKGNACMIDLMPRRQAVDKQGGPLTNRDLVIGRSDCDTAYAAGYAVAEQKAALAKVGAK